MTFCQTFADWAATASFTREQQGEVRLALLDTYGCIIAGWNEHQTHVARRAFGREATTTAAALVLGTAAHAQDFDDYEGPGSSHPSAPVFAALLGLSIGERHPMERLLVAYAVGFEAIVRLGEWMRYDHYAAGWHSTGTLGTVGATAAAARLLGLPAPVFAHALAISASLAGTLKKQFGTDAKALHAGLAARAGIEAARLAASGATGALDVFEGPYGFAELYHAHSRDPGEVLTRIGNPPGISEHAILRKPWPSCAYTHRVIAAALKLAPRLPEPSRWKRITVRMPEPYFRVASFLNPTNPNEARFSANYCALAALVNKAVGPASFTPEAYRRADILELLARSEVDAYDAGPSLYEMGPTHPDSVTVLLSDESVESETVGHVPGGPHHPMTPDDLRAKFAACGGTEATAELILASDGQALVGVDLSDNSPRLICATKAD